jgi:hypothetical protein
MSSGDYAKDITAEDLRAFAAQGDDIHHTVMEDKGLFFNDNSEPFSWCHFYELPIKQHIFAAITESTQSFDGAIQEEDVVGWLNQVIETPGQIGALPGVIGQIGNHFDEARTTKEAAEAIIPNMANALGVCRT